MFKQHSYQVAFQIVSCELSCVRVEGPAALAGEPRAGNQLEVIHVCVLERK